MPVYRQGDMWARYPLVDHFFITTNAVIDKKGALVMGAGIALEVKNRFPRIEVEAGKRVTTIKDYNDYYGVLAGIGGTKIGLFQVKKHWKQDADINLIRASTRELHTLANKEKDCLFVLNYPGIGYGKLSKHIIQPIIDILPNNIEIWEK